MARKRTIPVTLTLANQRHEERGDVDRWNVQQVIEHRHPAECRQHVRDSSVSPLGERQQGDGRGRGSSAGASCDAGYFRWSGRRKKMRKPRLRSGDGPQRKSRGRLTNRNTAVADEQIATGSAQRRAAELPDHDQTLIHSQRPSRRSMEPNLST